MTQTKKRMYEVRRGPAEREMAGVVYHAMAFTGEQAIEEITVEILGQDTALDEIKSRASTLVATEVVQHPETGEWVPVDWREKRIAEIESQVEDLMAELNHHRERCDKLEKLREEE